MEKLSLVVWFHQRLVRDDRVRQGCSVKLLNLEPWLWKSYHQIQLFSAFLYAGIEAKVSLHLCLLFHENIFCWCLGRCRVILVLLDLNACWLAVIVLWCFSQGQWAMRRRRYWKWQKKKGCRIRIAWSSFDFLFSLAFWAHNLTAVSFLQVDRLAPWFISVIKALTRFHSSCFYYLHGSKTRSTSSQKLLL